MQEGILITSIIYNNMEIRRKGRYLLMLVDHLVEDMVEMEVDLEVLQHFFLTMNHPLGVMVVSLPLH